MREMKDSGIAWIGKIPNNWTVERINIHLNRKEPRNPGNKEILSVYREYGVIPKSSRDDNHNVTSLDTSKYKYVKPGNLVINKMKAWQGSMGVSKYEGVVSPAYFIYHFIDNQLYKEYIHLLLRNCYKDEFRRISGGIREGQWDLSPFAFERTKLIIPPYQEQQAIADFLDDKCADIDSLTGDIQKQIDILNEYKKSVITQAVTKGIDPNVEMKDSGIAWIGKIPKNWEIKKIKNVICNDKDGLKIGPFGSALANKTIADGAYNIYGQANLVNDDFSYTKNTINKNTFHILKSYQVLPNDICLSMMGTIGKCKTVPVGIKEGIMDSHLIKIRLDKTQIISKFFEYVYDKDRSNICITEMQYVKKGSIMDGLNTSIVKNLRIVVPLISDQQAIVDFLDAKCADIDAAIAGKQKQLDVLKEYKKSLIYEYVTGKKEVPCRE